MNFGIMDQRKTDVKMLDRYYERLFEQKRSEKENKENQ